MRMSGLQNELEGGIVGSDYQMLAASYEFSPDRWNPLIAEELFNVYSQKRKEERKITSQRLSR